MPARRQKWRPSDAIIENSSNRRRGIGTENHCMHGKDAIVEEVLDWRPYLRLVLEGQQNSFETIGEPPLMPKSERFLTEPVKSSAS